MRVLTARERESFEMAFKCISRVVAITYTTQKIYEIKIQQRGSKELSKIPEPIMDMFNKAGLAYMQKMFCDIQRFHTIDILIKKFFKDKIQPKDYCFDGLLIIAPVKVKESTYTEFSSRISA